MATTPSLFPKEHGATAELVFPLLTGLTIARPGAVGIAFAVSAVAWFLAHEPLAVLMGLRGDRVLAAVGDRARRRVVLLAVLGVGAGAFAMAATTPAAREAALVPLGAALLLAPALVWRRQKTLWAEGLVVIAFAGMVLPVGVAAGVAWRTAWLAAAVWGVSFMLGTVAVHALKVRHKREQDAGWLPRVSPVLAVASVVLAVAAAALERIPWFVGLAIVPPALLAVAIGIVRVHPRHLKRVGWSLVAANTMTWICLLLA